MDNTTSTDDRGPPKPPDHHRGGAPEGNINALKHGAYSERFGTLTREGQQRMSVTIAPDEDAHRIREHLRKHPSLVYEEYRPDQEFSLSGGCYLLSEAYYHSQGGRDSGLDIYCLSWSDVEPDADDTHWFLREQETDRVVDLGLDERAQAEHVPYGLGTRRAFLTGYAPPSKRTQQVLDALDYDYEME